MRVVVVFFFKQKTAYEMRISDWSSDVCSSDLRVLGRAPCAPGVGDGRGVDSAERVEQRAMPTRVEQPAIVVLAVDLDELRAKLTQQPRRGGRIVDESAAAAVGLDDAADHQRLAGLDRDAVVGERRTDARGGIETSRHHRLADRKRTRNRMNSSH